MSFSRRSLLRSAAVGAISSLALGDARAVDLPVNALSAGEPSDDIRRIAGFNLGCQAWSFNHYTLVEAIEKTAETGSVTIEFYPGQKIGGDMPNAALDPNAGDDVIALVKDHLSKAGLRAVAFGVTGLSGNEASDRKTFDLAKRLGLNTIVSEPNLDAMDTIEKLVKEYDIKVAIHNHPKREKDPNYKHWDPDFTLSLVEGRDPRIGSCSDTGHWVRSGIKPIDAFRKLRGRVLEVHLKDLNEFTPDGHDVPFGTGVSDIPAILTELRSRKFDGNISIEYEHDWTTSVPEIAQCIGFVRGWGAAAG